MANVKTNEESLSVKVVARAQGKGAAVANAPEIPAAIGARCRKLASSQLARDCAHRS